MSWQKYAPSFRKMIAAASGLMLLALVATVVGSPQKAFADDCGPNAIVYCGFNTNTQFINYLKDNKDNYPNNPHRDLQAIMNKFGLSSADYDKFKSSAKSGTVYRSGSKVVVDGKTVMTDAKSLGRTTLDGRHNKSISIAGETYYYGDVSRVFNSSSIPAKVLFDEKGTAQFVVLTDCGNPVWGTPVESTAKCKALNQEPVAGTTDTFNFTTSTVVTGNATITKCVYDFGDGTKPVTSSSCSAKVKHTFAGGTYNVKVTVYATAPGGVTISDTCGTTVNVAIPYYECVAQKGPEPEGLKYTFITGLKYGNGATPKSAVFTFGDGSTTTIPAASKSASTITTTHTYAKTGTYSVTAIVHFTLPNGQDVTSNGCSWVVKPSEPPVAECKPGIPVGDVRCNPCPTDSSITADNPKCTTPATTLPNTGAGNVIAIGAAALVGGFLFYRQWMFRKHKREAYQAETGVSPLPLADPLATDDPLAETPLEPQQPVRSTFRRRRQF